MTIIERIGAGALTGPAAPSTPGPAPAFVGPRPDPIPGDYSGSAPTDALSAFGARLDQAVAQIQELPPEPRAVAENFALALDALSKAGLTTIVKRLKADPRGKELLFELVDDPTVRLLLGMHGIIRLPDPAQAERVAKGIGEDGSAAPASPHGGTSGGRAFVSLESMFRGPQTGHACGCGAADGGAESACACGGH